MQAFNLAIARGNLQMNEDGCAPRNAGIMTLQRDSKELQAIQFILVTDSMPINS